MVEKLFSGAYGKTLKPLFHLFLYTTNKLEIQVKKTAEDKYVAQLLNIDMSLPMDVVTGIGQQRILIEAKETTITRKTLIQLDPKIYYLKKVIYE